MSEWVVIYFEKLDIWCFICYFLDKFVDKVVIVDFIRIVFIVFFGVYKQFWIFCVVVNLQFKKEIRVVVEVEEKFSYEECMSECWKKDLELFGIDMYKFFLEMVFWLIIVFKKVYDLDEVGNKQNNYYVNELVGIVCGFLIMVIYNLGLVMFIYIFSLMNFLVKILECFVNECVYMFFFVGYLVDEVYVLDIYCKLLLVVS